MPAPARVPKSHPARQPPPDPSDPDPPTDKDREHRRDLIRKFLALDKLGAEVADLEPEDAVKAVAEVVAASVRIGALPTCSVTVEVSRRGGRVLASARKVGGEVLAIVTVPIS